MAKFSLDSTRTLLGLTTWRVLAVGGGVLAGYAVTRATRNAGWGLAVGAPLALLANFGGALVGGLVIASGARGTPEVPALPPDGATPPVQGWRWS